MKLSLILFFIAGAAATKDGSAAIEQAGSLRALAKGGNKGANPKPTINWRCQDRFDPNDWIATCNTATAGKVGHDQDTCQPCCDCDCDSSADVPDVTAAKTCDVLAPFDNPVPELTCADHDHADPVNGDCTDQLVKDACYAICYPTTTTIPPPTTTL